jgi:Holliday junction DNA helicase RuvA
VVLSLLAPGYFLRHVSAGDEARFHLLFQIVNEGNRGIPLAVAFPSTRDRDFFTKFISVSGIGVRAAVRAMTIPPGELASAIATGDIGVLKSLPGIGGSRAKQIVAKLQDSIAGFSTDMPASSEPGSASDARAILEQLGIPSAEAVSLVNAALEKAGPSASPSEIVRAAMKARS